MKFDKHKKITIELDCIRSAILLDAIMSHMDQVMKEVSIESVCKYLVLKEMGQEIVDQLIPKDQQEDFLRELLQNEVLLSALKREKEIKSNETSNS